MIRDAETINDPPFDIVSLRAHKTQMFQGMKKKKGLSERSEEFICKFISRTARRRLSARDGRRRAAPSARRKLPRGRSAPKGRHEAVSAARVIAITPRSRGTCKTSHASLGRQLLARNTTGRSLLVRAPSPVRSTRRRYSITEDRDSGRRQKPRARACGQGREPVDRKFASRITGAGWYELTAGPARISSKIPRPDQNSGTPIAKLLDSRVVRFLVPERALPNKLN